MILGYCVNFSTSFTYLFMKTIFIGHPPQASYRVRYSPSASLVFIKESELLVRWTIPANLLPVISKSFKDWPIHLLYLTLLDLFGGWEGAGSGGGAFRKYSNLGNRCATSVDNNDQLVSSPDALKDGECGQNMQKWEPSFTFLPLDFLRSRHSPLTISWSQRDPSASKRAGVTIWDQRSLGRKSQWISNIQKPVKYQLRLHHRERESWLKSASRNFHCVVGASDLGGNMPAPRNLS